MRTVRGIVGSKSEYEGGGYGSASADTKGVRCEDDCRVANGCKVEGHSGTLQLLSLVYTDSLENAAWAKDDVLILTLVCIGRGVMLEALLAAAGGPWRSNGVR